MYNLEEQIAEFYQFKILNPKKEETFDNLTKLAAITCGTQYSVINFIKSESIFNKSSFGIEEGDIPKEGSFCEQVIINGTLLEIKNSLYFESLKSHTYVLNAPYVRFFAGIPLKLFNSVLIGTLSVFDSSEKELSKSQKESLKLIAKQIETLIELSLQKDTLNSLFEAHLNSATEAMCIVGKENYNILSFNHLFENTIHQIYNRQVHKGNLISEFFNGINLSNFVIGFSKAINGEKVIVERLVTFDNFSVWYYMQYIPIRNSTGQIIAVGFTAKDVSAEHRYKELLDEISNLANVGGWEYNFVTNQFIWTPQTRRIFELEDTYEADEESIIGFIDGEYNKLSFKQAIENLFNDDIPFRLEIPVITALNTKKWIAIKAKALFNGRKCLRIFGAICDITNDKNLQLSLIENKERFKGIVENTADTIYELDVEGNFNYVSPGVFKMTGYLPSELVGSDLRKILHKDDLIKCEAFISNLISVGEDDEVIEYRIIHKDGHVEWHESKCCIIRRNGRLFVMGIARNITIWKNTQDKLKSLNENLQKNAVKLSESEKRYSDLFLESPQPMWLYDLESLNFLQVNKAAIETYGYSKEEFLKMKVWQVRIKEQQEDAKNYHQSNLYTGNNYSVRRQHTTKSGGIIEVELFSNLMVFNEKSYRLVIAVDVTGNIKYLNAIEEQNKKLKEIAWIQSHLVRHPLVNIMGMIPLIQRLPLEELKTNNIIYYLEREAKKLDEVIKDIVNKAMDVEKQELQIGI